MIENHPGGGGILAIESTVKTKFHNTTLLVTNNNLWSLPLTHNTKDYFLELELITAIGFTTNCLVINSSLPLYKINELISFIKKNPNKINYASSSIGSQSHLIMELFKDLNKLEIINVPYKGSQPALMSLMTGETQMMFTQIPIVLPHTKNNKIKILAVTSKNRSIFLENVITLSEYYPNFVYDTVYAVYSSKNMDNKNQSDIRNKILLLLNTDDIQKKFYNNGIELDIKMDIKKIGDREKNVYQKFYNKLNKEIL